VQARYAEAFDREHGCSEAEWLGWLPGAVGSHALSIEGGGHARIGIGQGSLTLHWITLPPRRIALMTLPRLAVRYRFEGVDDGARMAFMRHFDLYTQRGGG
jgi:hypothetical protein